MKNNRKGFTIVELVIVIAVVAVLAAVLIPTFSGIVEKANISSDIQLARNINVILQAESVGASAPATIDDFRELLDKNGISPTELKTPKYTIYWLKEEGVVILADHENVPIYPEEYMYNFYNEKTWIQYVGAGYQEVQTHNITIKNTDISIFCEKATHGRTYRSWYPLWAGPGMKITNITATMNDVDVECRLEYEPDGDVSVIIENVTGDIELTITTAPKSP